LDRKEVLCITIASSTEEKEEAAADATSTGGDSRTTTATEDPSSQDVCGSGRPVEPLYHYCLTREDLPLGTRFAQLIHAAGESSPGNLPQDTRAVALSAKDETQLLELEKRLIAAGIPHRAIREPDSPHFNALMAIGFPPAPRGTYKKFLSQFGLVK
jgi:hypothetical protein